MRPPQISCRPTSLRHRHGSVNGPSPSATAGPRRKTIFVITVLVKSVSDPHHATGPASRPKVLMLEALPVDVAAVTGRTGADFAETPLPAIIRPRPAARLSR